MTEPTVPVPGGPETAADRPEKRCPKARRKSGRKAPTPVPHEPHIWIAGVYDPVGDVDGYEAWCPGVAAAPGGAEPATDREGLPRALALALADDDPPMPPIPTEAYRLAFADMWGSDVPPAQEAADTADEIRRDAQGAVRAAWPALYRAARAAVLAEVAALVEDPPAPEPERPRDAFVVFHRSGFQAVYETREAAVEDCDDYLAKCWPGAEIVEDWINVNVPEARPAWFRYFTAPGMTDPPSWQEIRVRPLLHSREPAPEPERAEGQR